MTRRPVPGWHYVDAPDGSRLFRCDLCGRVVKSIVAHKRAGPTCLTRRAERAAIHSGLGKVQR